MTIQDIHGTATSHYGLTLVAMPGESLSLRLLFDRRRFETPAVQRMLRQLATLLRDMSERPDARIGDLSLLDAADLRELQTLAAQADASGRERMLDPAGRPAPVGLPGELWTADGALRKTGYRALLKDDGTIECLGPIGSPRTWATMASTRTRWPPSCRCTPWSNRSRSSPGPTGTEKCVWRPLSCLHDGPAPRSNRASRGCCSGSCANSPKSGCPSPWSPEPGAGWNRCPATPPVASTSRGCPKRSARAARGPIRTSPRATHKKPDWPRSGRKCWASNRWG